MNPYSFKFLIICSLVVVRSVPLILEDSYEITNLFPVAIYPQESFEISLKVKTTANNLLHLPLFNVHGDLVQTKRFQLPEPEKSDTGHSYFKIKYKAPELPSGIYSFDRHSFFIIKSNTALPLALIYPQNTIQAYNNYGGKSFYGYNSTSKQATPAVSFERPVPFFDEFLSLEFFKWLDLNYHGRIAYFVDRDLDSFQNIEKSELLIIPGHSEYWTRKARLNFDRFIEERGHAAVLSGNTCWWQVRYKEDSLICYQDASADPEGTLALKSVLWSDKSLNYSILGSFGQDFTRGGYGRQKDAGWDGYRICLNNDYLFKGTKLSKGDTLSLPTTEYDGTLIRGFSDGFPLLDKFALGFYKTALIGYDLGFRDHQTMGTWIAFQKSKTSGTVFHVGSTNWCDKASFSDSNRIPVLTRNMLNVLENDKKIAAFWETIQ